MKIRFLWDVFLTSLGAFGGPEAHYAVMIDQLAVKNDYVTEEEILELMSITTILPGPGSTQSIVAIGYKMGGIGLALLTFLVWSLPVLLLMTALSFLDDILTLFNISQEIVAYVPVLALSFICLASYRMTKKLNFNPLVLSLYILSLLVAFFVQSAWKFPLLLSLGAVVMLVTSNEDHLWSWHPQKINFSFLWAFVLVTLTMTFFIKNLEPLGSLIEKFYRYGYLVIGGGQVVVPLMQSELIDQYHYLSVEEFLRGYGLVQGMPGPMFSFAAYAGGMALRGSGPLLQFFGGLLSGLALFAPGILLILFVYPIWQAIRQVKGIQVMLQGMIPVATAFVVAAALRLLTQIQWDLMTFILLVLLTAILYSKKIPAPLVVVSVLALGLVQTFI